MMLQLASKNHITLRAEIPIIWYPAYGLSGKLLNLPFGKETSAGFMGLTH